MPSDANTIQPAMQTPSIPRSLGRILALAIPFALGAAITSALNLGNVALLSRVTDTGALHVLSLMQPSFLLVLALMEGLAITNQVFSARSRHNWPRRGVWRVTLQLCAIGLVIFGLVAAVGKAVHHFLPVANPVIATTLEHFPMFVLSMIPFVIFDIFYGALRGQGRILHGLLPFALLMVVNLGVLYFLADRLGWGFDAVLLANVAGPLIALPVIATLLWREVRGGEMPNSEASRARLRQLLAGVGIPVFASIIVGFVSASVAYPILSDLGSENAAAFFVVLRYRIAFMIPAIAIGSAIAILVNQLAEAGEGQARFRYLAYGVPIMLAAYALAAAALPHWNGMLDLLVPSQSAALRHATELMFQGLLLTFFLTPAAAMLQVILEQLGRGGLVLVTTVLCEGGTCVALIWAQSQGDMALVLQILTGFALLSFGLFVLQLLLLLRQFGRRAPQPVGGYADAV
ncbi:hypothetical protein [Phaeobacter sp. HF9A]|uniref:hypothetical protein n=1 Tax=Phaeobacter sp. HF9A TaxID=2721561 RepID=UPI00143029B6|nr:hypothetical protein [Phaeobacter sp. HF9A]NIZ12592.1 hypothetical protein [Phaeobacter sp. HF9A]